MTAVPLWFWATLAGVLGVCLGSFFTVVVHRWPAEQSLASPPSHCTACERRLGVLDLVPVLSWLALRGRCRGCGEKVGARYPLIEAATGALAAIAILAFGANLRGVAAAIMLTALVPVVVIDLEHRLIPDVIVLPAAAAGLGLMIADRPDRWWVPVAACFGAAAFLLALSLVYPGGMGMGDVKLALLLGAVLGSAVIPGIAIAFLAGALLGAVFLIRHGRAARTMAIPFGPFLAAGAALALWWGPAMLGWYAERLS